MKHVSQFQISFAVGIVLVGALLTYPGMSRADSGNQRVLAVYERAISETTIDLGAAGDSQGDMITFDNPVFNPTTNSSLGRSRGQCVRTAVGAAYECVWTTSLPNGSLMVAGPFYDAADSTLAITGGTGAYRNAQGEMLLRARPTNNGIGEFDFIFRISKPD
jgi:allene oxide cyclase